MATIDEPLGSLRVPRKDSSVSEYLYKWVATVDHKRLGLMYIVAAILFLVVAGLMGSAIRLQLAIPNNHLIAPGTFNRLFTMHGTTMVFFVGMPLLAGFANYLVPLMIGARDMAFPRLNAFGFWIFRGHTSEPRQQCGSVCFHLLLEVSDEVQLPSPMGHNRTPTTVAANVSPRHTEDLG